MIYLTAEAKIFLAVEPVDFRKQFDGLIAICKSQLNHSPNSGNIFVFINRSRTMIRVLRYHCNGYWLATKRLSKGRYNNWPRLNQPVHSVQANQLTTIIKGVLANHSN